MQNKTPFEAHPAPVPKGTEWSSHEAIESSQRNEAIITGENRIERVRRKAMFAFRLKAIRPESSAGATLESVSGGQSQSSVGTRASRTSFKISNNESR